MRVDVTPRRADITAGMPLPVQITITNTSTVIGGYTVRVLGADPGWVALETTQVSLFPDESTTVVATVTAPVGIAAGQRRIAVQVRELTPPESSTVAEIDLTVPSSKSLAMRVDPMTVTAGHTAAFSVIVENTGNTMVTGSPSGEDPESKVKFAFTPEQVSLAPGENALVDVRASARPALAGSPTVRLLSLYFDEHNPDDFFAPDAGDGPRSHADEQPLANATFLQRPVLTRGAISMMGLLAAITVFAIVITLAMSRIVGQSTADRNLALQVAAARDSGGSGGTSGVAGTVHLLTSGKPVPAVAVNVYQATNTSSPVATTATNAAGAYAIGNLAAGQYKISFRGAGFVQLWFPGAATEADATTVALGPGQHRAGLNVTLGGVPASINGTVVGADVSSATLYLETIGSSAAPVGQPAALPTAPTNGAAPPAPPGTGAVIQTVPIGSDGKFSLANVPSPSVYDLVVSKTGYATSTQRINVGAGETRNGVQITLRLGDGLIAGTITSSSGPLGGVTVTATAGQSTADTVSLTVGQTGSFTLRGLPTPATFTIVASKTGFASQTVTLSLAAGQKLTGVVITLSSSAGTLAGRVSVGGQGSPGVSVTITDGQLTEQTVTQSTGTVGQWSAGGLPVPGTYTITFARADLSSQTLSVSLDSGGAVTPGSQASIDANGLIQVAMQSNTQDVFGFVTQPGETGCNASTHGLAEATVTLNSGASTFTTTTAGASSATCGEYWFGAVPPGTYTLTAAAGSGTSPSSSVITVVAGGKAQQDDVKLPAPASVTGRVVQGSTDGAPLCGWTVDLYLQAQYPTVIAASTTTCAGALPDDGTFSVKGIAAGTYVVEVRQDPSSSPAASEQVFVQPSAQVNAGTIVVTSGG